MNIAPYRKLVVALAAAFGIAATAVSDGAVSSSEAIEIGLAFLASFGVYRAANEAL